MTMKNLSLLSFLVFTVPFTLFAQVTDTGDEVGIGVSTPTHKLDVDGDVNLSVGSKLLINSRPVVSTVGTGNTFIGDLSGNAITTGSNNAFIGYKSGEVNTSGHSNAFIGFKAGENNTSGFSNAFIGQQAGRANLTGKTNVMIGRRAGFTSASGDDNVFIGHLAGDSNNGGSSNTYLGSGADGLPTLINSTAIGANASVTQDSSIVLGNGAKVGIGTSAPGYDLDVSGDMNFTGTLYQNGVPFSSGGATGPTGATGAVGPQGPTGPAGAATAFIQDADGNTKVQTEETTDDDIIRFDLGGTEYFRMQGPRLEVDNSNGSVFIGDSAGASNPFSYYNTFVGANAGKSNASGYRNAAFGLDALKDNVGGQYNSAFGVDALHDNTSGRDNTALGWGALGNNTTADNNTSVGALSLFNTNSGSHNVALGHSALYGNMGGNQNVSIGYSSGANALGSGNVFLGYSAGFQENGSNRLYIENSAANPSNALIYGEFDNDLLRVNGELNINEAYSFPTVDGTSGQVLRTDGSGTLSWQTISGGSGSTGPTGPTGPAGANGATGPTGPTGDSYWNQSGSNINYTAGNVAIGTPGTTHRLEIDGSTISTQAVADIDVAYTGNSNVQALNTYSVPNPGYGYGLFSTGGNIGVFGSNPGAGYLGNSYAIKGSATGTGGNRYAVHGEASNPGGNFAVGLYGWGGNATVSYGVWGAATGGTTNWAGYFAQGNVHIQNNLGIGNTSPNYDLDVSGDINFTGDLYQNGVLFSGGGGGGSSLWSQSGSNVYYDNGNIAVGTTPTYNKVRILGDTLIPHPVVDIDATFSGNMNVDGINVNSVPADGYGRGISSTGGEMGVLGSNPGGAHSGASFGVQGYSTGTAGDRYGLYGTADNSGGNSATGVWGSSSGTAATNYGVYGSAGGGTTSWAGYFKNGNVYIENNTGIGTETPAAKLDVQGFPTSNSTIVNAEVNASSASDIIAVNGVSNPSAGYGIGVEGTGGYKGVNAINPGGTYAGSTYGMYAYSTGSAGTRYGVYGYAYNTGANAIGVYGSASGATNNWAGYFVGNSYVSGDLRVGTTSSAPGYLVNVDGGVSCSQIRAINMNGWAGYLIGDAYVSENLAIGTTTPASGFALSVNGGIMCEEIKVQDSGSWPDYVFAEDYDLPSLDEVEEFIDEESHLPGVPDACTLEEEGINLGEMQRIMMEKIEEGMLYTIQLKKEIEALQKKNAELEARLNDQ